MNRLRRLLIFTHRWLGIALSLMIVVWFASGITMMYFGGMPRLTPQARLDHLPTLDLARVLLKPAQAAILLKAGDAVGAPVLVTIRDRPAWRFPDAGDATVFADDGTRFQPLDEREGAEVVQRFVREPFAAPRFVRSVESPDQWTLTLSGIYPLFKYEAGDGARTEVYVDRQSGEVVQATTGRDRALAWISTIPHWLYFAALRLDQPLWYRVVVVLATLACVLAVLGLVLAFTQYRRPLPYRGGMRWHYVAGAIFGVFTLTWAFSGLISMEPWDWLDTPEIRVPADAFTGGEPELAAYDGIDLAALPALVAPRFIKAVSLERIHGAHYLNLQTSAHADAKALPLERLHAPYDVGGRGLDTHVLVNASTLMRHDAPLAEVDILARLVTALPGINVVEATRLDDYDDYYYSRSRQTPLPVLRIKLDDPLRTWLYVDLRTSALVANVHRYSRIERWLYSGLHSLDFKFWYARRPLWDLAMIVLLLGGLTSSCLGLYYGLRRLARRPSRA